ncbi:MAG: hypothetical protein RI883_1178, partial [Bacteroidota bacterium]
TKEEWLGIQQNDITGAKLLFEKR